MSTLVDDGTPAEIDFSGGVHGKLYRLGATLISRVRLDAGALAYLFDLATRRCVTPPELANDLLKTEIAILES